MKATAAKPEKTIEKKKCVVCPALTLGWGNVRGGVVCSKECNEAYYKNLYRRAS
jgi:predicted nucleic acid-binding Zn ribbon protein